MIQDRTAEEYIRKLRFRRREIGGCDEEDVLLKMRGLRDIYRQQSESLQRDLETEEERGRELEEQLRKVSRERDAALGELARLRAQAKSAVLPLETGADKPRPPEGLQRPAESPQPDALQKAGMDAARETQQLQQQARALRLQYESLTQALKSNSQLLASELDEILKIIFSLRGKVGMLSGVHAQDAK